MWTEPKFWALWLTVAAFMEFWSMLLHGQLWHGVLWFSHRSHHEPRTGPFEWNDIFAVFHAVLAMAGIMAGLEFGIWWAAAIGFGMTTFGMAYFVVHDGLIHGRLPVAFLLRWDWVRRVRNAHRVHHQREGGPYGLFLGPWELRRSLGRERGE
jgi:beta-carotene 3-hydroxylase